MKITILTLFKEQFDSFKETSIIHKAIEKGLVEIEVIDYRKFSTDRLKRVDDAPYGGGAGMLIKCQPIVDCLNSVKTKNSRTILLSAKGSLFKQSKAHELAKEEHIILICGHYEGIDDRILNYVDEPISVGDFILTGGEIPAMLISDAIIRLLDGAIKSDSIEEESFENNLLEYDQYTSPREFEGYSVPDILFSGNHQAIKEYRFKQSVLNTLKYRPELLDASKFTKQEKKWYDELENSTNEINAIQKAKKFMK